MGFITGTPWHYGTISLSEDEERRHKSWCENNINGICRVTKRKCGGSAHCDHYKKENNVLLSSEKKQFNNKEDDNENQKKKKITPRKKIYINSNPELSKKLKDNKKLRSGLY